MVHELGVYSKITSVTCNFVVWVNMLACHKRDHQILLIADYFVVLNSVNWVKPFRKNSNVCEVICASPRVVSHETGQQDIDRTRDPEK